MSKEVWYVAYTHGPLSAAEIAQLGERQTEDLKVPGSIPGFGTDRFPSGMGKWSYADL